MNIFQAVVYGIIQGLGEFLPISSSAHLKLAPWLFGWKDPGLAFDVALHLGTLVAVVLFFWKDWVNLTKAGLTKPKTNDGKLFWFLAIASVPGGLAGVLFESKIENGLNIEKHPEKVILIGVALMIMGIILYLVDKYSPQKVKTDNPGFKRSILIGISQAFAIIPGVSRSGITMTAGRFLGLTRERAARFSFLLSTPIILAAGLYKTKDLLHNPIDTVPFFVAILTSAIVGALSIKFLLQYLKNKGFGIFTFYRLAFGAIVILVYLTRLIRD